MSDEVPREGLPSRLDAVAGCLAEAWPEGHPALRAMNVLRGRLSEARLQVAILGQFKRGKSTLINALLRTPLLPSAVVPATAIPTFIAWESAPRIHVTYQDGRPPLDIRLADPKFIREQLHQWVTEEGNPVNRRPVHRVDLFVPADVLRSGIVLIDTPGVGSTLQHNTDAALEVLLECDTALFVVSADPPITAAEFAYLRAIQPHVVRLFFVLNKIDYLEPKEQPEALDYLHTALRLALQPGTNPTILPISARRALDAAARADDFGLGASGLLQIERNVLLLLSDGKLAALRASVGAKATMLVGRGLADLALKTRALESPLEDLERRAGALGEALGATRRQRQEAHDTLQGDRRRAVANLERQAERLRQEAQRTLGNLVQRQINDNDGNVDRSAIQESLDSALPEFFQTRSTQVAAEFQRSVEEILARHQARADALVASVRETTASLFEITVPQHDTAERSSLGPEPYWVTQKLVHALIPSSAGIMRRMLPGTMRQRYLRHELQEQIAGLVQRNVENLRWATFRSLDDTFRRFVAQHDERLAEALAATEGNIREVIERRRRQAGRTADELHRLCAVESKLQSFASDLAGPVA